MKLQYISHVGRNYGAHKLARRQLKGPSVLRLDENRWLLFFIIDFESARNSANHRTPQHFSPSPEILFRLVKAPASDFKSGAIARICQTFTDRSRVRNRETRALVTKLHHPKIILLSCGPVVALYQVCELEPFFSCPVNTARPRSSSLTNMGFGLA